MLLSKPQVLDDRGRHVDVFKLTRESAREDAELTAIMTRVHESANLMHEKLRWEHLLYLLFCVAVMAGGIWLARVVPGLPPWTTGIIGASGWIMIALLMGFRTRHRYAHRIVESTLRIGRCPTCGYRLRGTPVDEAGVIGCPECGSAWLASRVGTSEVAAAEIPTSPEMPGDTRSFGWIAGAWWSRLPTIVDDRDRSMAMTDPRLPRLGASARGDEVRRSLRAALRPAKFLWITATVLVLAVLVTPLVGMTITMGPRRGPLMALLMPLFWSLAGVRMISRVARGRSRVLAKRTKAALLEQRVCPACGGELTGAGREEDGCTVCPVCRAAWKIGRGAGGQDSSLKTTSV